MIILDTNVLSELMKPTPDRRMLEWADRQLRDRLVTTAVTVMELWAGAEMLVKSKRRGQLENDIERALDDLIGGRILSFDWRAAYETAVWRARRRRAGHQLKIPDAQIAGIALARRIPIATRDAEHFKGLDVKVIDPWTA